MIHSVLPALKQQRMDKPDRSCQVSRDSATKLPLRQLMLMKIYVSRMFCLLKGNFNLRISVTQSLVQLNFRTYKCIVLIGIAVTLQGKMSFRFMVPCIVLQYISNQLDITVSRFLF
jgi:hypothetical protein